MGEGGLGRGEANALSEGRGRRAGCPGFRTPKIRLENLPRAVRICQVCGARVVCRIITPSGQFPTGDCDEDLLLTAENRFDSSSLSWNFLAFPRFLTWLLPCTGVR